MQLFQLSGDMFSPPSAWKDIKPIGLDALLIESARKLEAKRPTALDGVDPYAIWGLESQLQYLTARRGRFGVLLELRDASKRPLGVSFATPEQPRFRYVTGHVDGDALLDLVLGSSRTTGSATNRKMIARLVLAAPRRASDHPSPGHGTPETNVKTWLTHVDALTRRLREAFRARTRPMGSDKRLAAAEAGPPGPLLGIIDDGCNLMSLFSGSVLLRALWHQGNPARSKRHPLAACRPMEYGQRTTQEPPERLPGTAWRPGRLDKPSNARGEGPTLAAYGFELDLERASGSLFGPARPEDAEEHRLCQRAEYFFPMPSWTHGTGITDVAAGFAEKRRRKLLHRHPVESLGPGQVVFVQLPEPAVEDTSGGSLAAHAIDGIDYVMAHAAASQHVVINLSYGTHGGAHDGTSPFEMALAERLEYYRGREGGEGPADPQRRTLHVVLPAGNGQLLRTHASGYVMPGQTRTLRWRVLPDDGTECFVELWFPRDVQVYLRLVPPGDAAVRKRLIAPGDSYGFGPDTDSETLDAGSKSATLHGFVAYQRAAPESETSQMALIAIAPTVRRMPLTAAEREVIHGGSVNPPKRARLLGIAGTWAVELSNIGASATPFDAWIERDDVAPGRHKLTGRRQGRQAYFLEEEVCDPVSPEGTLNGIATFSHRRLHVVGAMRRSDSTLSRYSAAGPVRNEKSPRVEGPDVVIAADDSMSSAGRLVAGMTAGSRVRLSGTSVAAAEFARLLCEHLADPNGAPDPRVVSSCIAPSRERPRVAGEARAAHPLVRGEFRRRPID